MSTVAYQVNTLWFCLSKVKDVFFRCIASLICYQKETATVIKKDQPKTHGQARDLKVEGKYDQKEKSKLQINCVPSLRRTEQRGKRIRVNDEVKYSHGTATEVRVKVKIATGL